MTDADRRRAFLEIGFAFGVLIGCFVAGIWLANLPGADQGFRPDEPFVRASATPTYTAPPVVIDPYTVHTRRATVAPTEDSGKASPAGPAPQGGGSAPAGAAPSRAPSRPPRPPIIVAPPAPVVTETASPAPAVRPCRVSVLGLCVVRGRD